MKVIVFNHFCVFPFFIRLKNKSVISQNYIIFFCAVSLFPFISLLVFFTSFSISHWKFSKFSLLMSCHIIHFKTRTWTIKRHNERGMSDEREAGLDVLSHKIFWRPDQPPLCRLDALTNIQRPTHSSQITSMRHTEHNRRNKITSAHLWPNLNCEDLQMDLDMPPQSINPHSLLLLLTRS